MTSTDNSDSNPVTRPRVGRPRSVESRRAIIQSAMNILQNDGYAALNIEAIAAKAGVSKQTIYRWWASAAFIVLEALLADMPAQETIAPDTGSLKSDLLELVRPTVRALSQRRGPVFKALIAEAQADARFAEALRNSLMAAHRELVHAVVGRAKLRGEVVFDVDDDLAADMIFGTDPVPPPERSRPAGRDVCLQSGRRHGRCHAACRDRRPSRGGSGGVTQGFPPRVPVVAIFFFGTAPSNGAVFRLVSMFGQLNGRCSPAPTRCRYPHHRR
jgi:AcrR family transcriptional regulator